MFGNVKFTKLVQLPNVPILISVTPLGISTLSKPLHPLKAYSPRYVTFDIKEKDIKINDLSKKLSLPVKAISDGLKFLEESKLILKKTTGFIVIDLQEVTLNNLYKPNLTQSKETVENVAKNQARAKAIEHINNMYFQGIMGPSWYNDIDLWFRKYNFDEQVMIALFDYFILKKRKVLNLTPM